ncbi:MAG: hypothetical protein JO364_09745 [Pseudonocardiales bacterium]|nr:hypothetical protein [Pseudonocardiales bacterium]MBV9030575.1 hypothetical protein [Pseudonocardiales bacterium]
MRRDARGLPILDDEVLEQMTADVAETARRYLIDPPATVFSRMLGARDDVFTLIAGRQQPGTPRSCTRSPGRCARCWQTPGLSNSRNDRAHPFTKRQATRAGIGFTELSNGFASTEDPAGLPAICDRLGPGAITVFFERWAETVVTVLGLKRS